METENKLIVQLLPPEPTLASEITAADVGTAHAIIDLPMPDESGPSPEEKIYKHTLPDGREFAGTAEQAKKLCPVMGQMATADRITMLENADAASRAAERGRARRQEAERKKQEFTPQAPKTTKDKEPIKAADLPQAAELKHDKTKITQVDYADRYVQQTHEPHPGLVATNFVKFAKQMPEAVRAEKAALAAALSEPHIKDDVSSATITSSIRRTKEATPTPEPVVPTKHRETTAKVLKPKVRPEATAAHAKPVHIAPPGIIKKIQPHKAHPADNHAAPPSLPSLPNKEIIIYEMPADIRATPIEQIITLNQGSPTEQDSTVSAAELLPFDAGPHNSLFEFATVPVDDAEVVIAVPDAIGAGEGLQFPPVYESVILGDEAYTQAPQPLDLLTAALTGYELNMPSDGLADGPVIHEGELVQINGAFDIDKVQTKPSILNAEGAEKSEQNIFTDFVDQIPASTMPPNLEAVRTQAALQPLEITLSQIAQTLGEEVQPTPETQALYDCLAELGEMLRPEPHIKTSANTLQTYELRQKILTLLDICGCPSPEQALTGLLSRHGPAFLLSGLQHLALLAATDYNPEILADPHTAYRQISTPIADRIGKTVLRILHPVLEKFELVLSA